MAFPTEVSAWVTIVAAVSVGSERLVEIIKSFNSYLSTAQQDPHKESRRKGVLQLLTVVACLITVLIMPDYGGDSTYTITQKIGIALAASAGSVFWNSILGYVTKVKDTKSADAFVAKKNAGMLK